MVATVEQLAALVRGRLLGDGSVPIHAARPVKEAGPGDITFVENERYALMLRTSPASAAIVGPHFRQVSIDVQKPVIEVDDPMTAFLTVRSHLKGTTGPRWSGVHPQAYVAPTARLGADVAIHPFAYVGENVELADGTTLYPGVVVGDRCKLGRNVVLHSNVVLYDEVRLGDRVVIHAGSVIGGDGFGFRLIDGRHVKVPQTGRVEVGDDVEIGANCTIDRATFEVTRIGEGTKIDNLVQIAHNNLIGRHNLICAGVGIGGSCKVGDYVIMAGQVGVKDQTVIGDRAQIGAQSGLHRDVAAGQSVFGTPARPAREQHKLFHLVARLPEMYRQLRELTETVARLTATPAPQGSSAEADADQV